MNKVFVPWKLTKLLIVRRKGVGARICLKTGWKWADGEGVWNVRGGLMWTVGPCRSCTHAHRARKHFLFQISV